MTPSTHRQNVLRAYRELLKLVKRLPGDQRAKSWQEARATVRQHVGEADPVRQADLLKELVAKISFLRVITPRIPGEKSAVGAGHWVLRNGELVEGEGAVAGTRCVRAREGSLQRAGVHCVLDRSRAAAPKGAERGKLCGRQASGSEACNLSAAPDLTPQGGRRPA